ncbi:MAG: VWA domain-containing protein, partial [Acidobacteria bacterium]|nr:VWA domain-containing protein [Acidobacteriota bacterium]
MIPLTFLAPLFLAGAAAAAIPVVLHLLRREPEPRVKFAAVKLLMRAPVEQTEKRHLRELLLLALRMAALALLALAFARPFFAAGGAVASAGVTIVALDTSYSLSAPGRFERAKALAREAIAQAPPADLVGVVAFADTADEVAEPSADRVLATAAIDQASVGFGATKYRAGLSAASHMLKGARGTIVVVTDLQESGWAASERVSVPESANIEIADVGVAPEDLALIATRPAGDQVIATIRNTGAAPRGARVRLTLDGRDTGERAITVGANTVADVMLPASPGAAEVAVTLDDPDGLQANNTRYAVLGDADRPSLLVVTSSGDLEREAYYLKVAIEAGGAGPGSYHAAAASGAQLASWTDDRLAAHAAVVLLSTRGLERPGRELLATYARNGGGLLIATGPEVDGG